VAAVIDFIQDGAAFYSHDRFTDKSKLATITVNWSLKHSHANSRSKPQFNVWNNWNIAYFSYKIHSMQVGVTDCHTPAK